MEREDVLKFTNSVVLLSKLFAKVEDRFLAEKLYRKISDMVSAFVGQYSTMRCSVNVAQYNHTNLLNSIDNLIDYLEYLEHDLKSDATPLLLSQRNLLKFKLHILKQNQILKSVGKKVENKAVVISETNLKPILKHKTVRLALKSNSNKEKIFNFIKKFPDARAKEIIYEFNALSGRTVKRNLKELVDEGLLKKKSEGGAVHYLVSNL